ncbi:MAG: ATP-dependent zinc metalloprotease FtsH [Victivallales bacterium]|nr:ATP-dependent zinc metalloprotease FtsH [Victivallales bacterium]
MSNNDSDFDPSQEQRPRKSPVAAVIWLLIFAFFCVLIYLKYYPSPKVAEWNQSDFEQALKAGKIASVVVTPETDRIFILEGEYHKDKNAVATEKTAPQPVPPTALKPAEKYFFHCRVIYSEDFNRLLASYPQVKVEVHNRDTWWPNMIVTLLPILLIIGLIYFLFSRQIKMAGKGAMQFGKSKARMIMPEELHVGFDDVAGADEAKEEVQEIIEYLRDPLKFKLLGGKIPKGALLMGPPGTGKTLLAKAVASAANVPFFSISGSDFVEMFVGVGASRVRDMFEQARRHCPCLIFIDEIDAVGRSRFSGMGGGHDEREQTLNAMLVEMDGLETQGGVIVLAATNRPDVLDPALLRPGRFDRQIVLDLPDIAGRRKILEVHAKNIKIDTKVDLDIIARGTPGFSGADLANLVNEAALLAARNNRDAATMADMEEARDKVRWGRERRSRKISERERRLTAYHEAGHTLVAMNCQYATPVHKVTIIPRGQAYLGATMTLPEDDSYTQSRCEFLDEMAVLMGGRIAEEIVFKDITSGASSDIEHATKIARAMVCTFGMDEKLGPVLYLDQNKPLYVRRDGTPFEAYSPETAREIDLEVKRLLLEAQQRARSILETRRNDLETLSRELLEKETLDGKQIRELLHMPEPEASSHPQFQSGI